jgi:hypothetical protein
MRTSRATGESIAEFDLSISFRRVCRLTACVVAALWAAEPLLAQRGPAPESGPRLDVRMLPDVGRGSEATCAVRIPDNGTILIGGSVVDAADYLVCHAAYWAANDDSISGPHLLPDLGHGGAAFASRTLPFNDGLLLAFAGTVIDDAARTQPAAWVGVGAEANLFVLPTPENAGGEAHGVAVGDVDNDDLPDIIVCGLVNVVDGTSNTMMAAIWFRMGDGNDTFALRLLPGLSPDGDSAALDIAHTWDGDLRVGLHANGYSYDALGNRVAVRWMIDWDNPAIRQIADLPPGYDSTARTETVGANETITVGGSIRAPQGPERPVLYDIDRDGLITLLPLPTSATGGRVNSIIAILIGLVAGGEVSTQQGSSAAIWINQPEIPNASRVIDLNRLPSNRPQGVRLQAVHALILPYLEQDNVYKFVGTAGDAQGRRQGFLGGIVGSDHAWGVVAR